MTTPPLDLTAERARAGAELAKPALSATRAARDARVILALLDRVEGWMKRAEDASMARLEALSRAEAAEKKVAAVRESLEAHPKACDRHTEDDPIKCGWKRAVADVTHALDSTPYRTLPTEPLVSDHIPETETAP